MYYHLFFSIRQLFGQYPYESFRNLLYPFVVQSGFCDVELIMIFGIRAILYNYTAEPERQEHPFR